MRYPFRIDWYNLETGVVDASVFVETPSKSNFADDGVVKRTELIVLPLNLPVFGLGLNYLDNFAHPAAPGQSDLVYIDEKKSIVYDRNERRRYRLILDEYFPFSGEYILISVDSDESPKKRFALKRTKEQLEHHVNGLKGKRFSGELVHGKVSYITVMDRDLKISVMEAIDTSLMRKLIESKHKTITIWLESENRMEFGLPAELLTRK